MSNSSRFPANLSESDPAVWSAIPIFCSICSVAAFITNGSALILFLKNPSLRTDFNIYLIALLLLNFLSSVCQSPVDIINSIHQQWHLGPAWCTFYIYWGYCVAASLHNTHALITLNRIWAVAWPINYRHYHSRKTAIGLCLVVVFYVHAYALPGVIMDALWYRLPPHIGCFVNSSQQRIWSLIDELLIFDLSAVIVIGAYPYILYKHLQRRTRKVGEGAEMVSAKTAQTSRAPDDVDDEIATQQIQSTAGGTKGRKKGSHGFLILTLLTFSVAVCWVPIFTFFTLLQFTALDAPLFYKVAVSLFYVQSFLDPIYFAFALKDLREEYKKLLSCYCSTV